MIALWGKGVDVVFFAGASPQKNTTYSLPPQDFPKTLAIRSSCPELGSNKLSG
jgi:hypothetical protein